MAHLEFEDIQGIIVRGYGNLPEACFMPLVISDPVKVRPWLGALADRLCDGLTRPDRTAVNVAFTASGLKTLGLDEDSMLNFSEPFLEGMHTKRRGRILGDTGEYSAKNWRWGNKNQPVHLLLLLYGSSSSDLTELRQEFRDGLSKHGLDEVLPGQEPLPLGVTLPGRKEHFGFRDGISQPGIVGLKKGVSPDNTVAAGEFVLGYTNEYGKYPISPSVALKKDPARILPAVPTSPGGGVEPGDWPRDLGRNGTYLVFRQLEQDVHAFWDHVRKSVGHDEPTHPAADAVAPAPDSGGDPANEAQDAKCEKGTDFERALTRLAAKMVGRWPSGAPVTEIPDQDVYGRECYLKDLIADAEGEYYDKERAATLRKELAGLERLKDDDDFGYFENDRYGARCPIGSHLRRSNPRDSFTDSPEESVRLTKLHRIIRRGRAYGTTSTDWVEEDGRIHVHKVLEQGPVASTRGLHFLAFNADIGRQFEFIQDTWINDPKFLGLYADADPIVGDQEFKGLPDDGGIFTEQSQPVRHHHHGLKRFVKMRGGAYFFMPGIRAVRYLSRIADSG